jgi:FkbM family methyltransferase
VALRIVAPHLPENPVILEGGAFNGEDTVRMARFWPGGTIYSFEPVPELYQRTKRNVAAYKNVKVYDLALSDKVGTATFHLSEDDCQPGEPSQSGSLLTPKEHKKVWPTISFKKQIKVATTTIDEWADRNGVAKIDLMWLDIQGSELIAIKAAPRIIKTVKAIIAEVEFVELYAGQPLFKETRDWLAKRGFKMKAADFDLKIAPSKGVFGNAIFVRK